MLSIFAARAQSTSPVPARGAGTKRAPVVPEAKKRTSPGMGKDQLTLSKKSTHGPAKHGPVKPAPVQTPAPVPPPPPPPPQAPVAESVDKAIEMALKGEPVRVPMPNKGLPRDLAVRQLEPVEGAARYEATLGTQKVTMAIAAGQNAEAAVTKTLQLLVAAPNDLRDPVTAVRVEDASDETERFTVDSSNMNGHPVSVSFKRTGVEANHSIYELSEADCTVRVLSPVGNDRGWELAQAAWLYDQIPAPMRGVLKTIEINNEGNPQDAYWEETYHMKGFVSAATGGEGVIHFWHGDRNMYDDVFHHEVGHLLGQKLSTKGTMWPDGWEDAIKADGQTPTEYAKASPAEDFAESWSVYARLKAGKPVYHAGTRDVAVADFEAKYPARAKILAAAWESETKQPVAPAAAQAP